MTIGRRARSRCGSSLARGGGRRLGLPDAGVWERRLEPDGYVEDESATASAWGVALGVGGGRVDVGVLGSGMFSKEGREGRD